MNIYTILLALGLVTASHVQAQFIQGLVDAAAPGATVVIPPGTYIENVIIDKDITLQGAGAGISIVDGNRSGAVITITAGTVSITGLTITHGYIFSSNAGGIVNFGSLILSNSEIIGNVSERGGAGGISNNGTLVLNNCRVSGNEGEEGGGIANGGQATLNNCTIDRNSGGGANGGGGGGLSNGALLTLHNCTVSNNETLDSWGGGIVNGGTLNLNHCTISANQALGILFDIISGGGVANYSSGTVNCQNTIIAGNLATRPWPDPTTAGPDFFGTLTSQGYNLIGNTTDTVISGITTGNLLDIDPLLGPLQNNGGPTDTHALLPGSPALDAGITGGLSTDERGVPRPIEILSLPNMADGSDIGAFEFDGVPTAQITCPADIASNNDPSQCSAIVNYPAPLLNGGTGNALVVCNPPSGSAFPVGATTVTCTATAAAGNSAACSFIVTVNDIELPKVSCAAVIPFKILQNPLRKVGRLQLLASDNCDSDPKIYIGDSRSSFVAGPFHNLDQVEIGAGPSLTPNQHAPASGPNVAVVFTKGEPLLWVVDSAGNGSTPIKCK